MEKTGLALLVLIFVIPVAFGVQVNSSTDIYSFDVTNCQVNETSLGCSDAWVQYSCDISNYAYIDYTLLRIEGTDYTASRTNQLFFYNYHKGVTTTSINTSLDFERVTIHDVGGGVALYFPQLSVNLSCHACAYTIIPGVCQMNDTHIVQYIGDGSANCTSYNATESCDYCTPAWSITSACAENNTEFRTYADANSCYGVTSLYADSCSYSFANCDSVISCSYLRNDFNCPYDLNPWIDLAGNRISWYCSLPNGTDYHCISYVKQLGQVIQTNPQQKTYSSGVMPVEQETREFFTAQNGLVNPYFTTTNLKANVTYIFGVECSSPSGSLVTEHYVMPIYRSLDEVASRTVWLKDNLGFVLGGAIIVVILLALLLMAVGR